MNKACKIILFSVVALFSFAACAFGQASTTPAAVDSAAAAETEQPATNLPPKPLAGYVICIDPGHPSEVNSGFARQNGTTETEINWQVALRLKRILQNEYGATVKMTKFSLKEKVTNRRRAEIANEAEADAAIRLHCDSEPSGKRSGIAIYYPDRQGKAADGKVGPSAQVCAQSAELAAGIHTGIVNKLTGKLTDNGIKTDYATAIGRKQGALTGSVYSQVPVALVEMVFLSNPQNAAFVKSSKGQELLAAAFADGLATYLKTSP